jgi:hypothetical protein
MSKNFLKIALLSTLGFVSSNAVSAADAEIVDTMIAMVSKAKIPFAKEATKADTLTNAFIAMRKALNTAEKAKGEAEAALANAVRAREVLESDVRGLRTELAHTVSSKDAELLTVTQQLTRAKDNIIRLQKMLAAEESDADASDEEGEEEAGDGAPVVAAPAPADHDADGSDSEGEEEAGDGAPVVAAPAPADHDADGSDSEGEEEAGDAHKAAPGDDDHDADGNA